MKPVTWEMTLGAADSWSLKLVHLEPISSAKVAISRKMTAASYMTGGEKASLSLNI
jgi:hypothetical protein